MTLLLQFIVVILFAAPMEALANGGGNKAIVAIADEPISAMSVLPKNATDAEKKHYVIRVKKRIANANQLTEVDQFETIGCLQDEGATDPGALGIHQNTTITLNVATNFDHAWNIYAVDGGSDGEHSHLVIKNAKTGRYISNVLPSGEVSAVHLKETIKMNGANAITNYIKMVPYADHVQHKVEVSKSEYDSYTGTNWTKVTEGGKYYFLQKQDIIDNEKHFMYLGNTNYKIHADNNSGYHISMASNTIAGFNDFDADGHKDDIVFEIVEVEIAEAGTDVTYKFNVKDGTKDLYHFYLQTKTTSESSIKTQKNEIESTFDTSLTYYSVSGDGEKKTSSGFYHVTVDCTPNFPFLLSEEIRSFDDANMNQRLNFFTMSMGAPDDKTDGYYVGLENAVLPDDVNKLIRHGHYDSVETPNYSNYTGKMMTDFRRHIDGSLLWYACKAKDEINDPNAIRLYLFTSTTHPLVAVDAIHNSSENGYWDVESLKDDASASHANCNHDVFQVVKIGGTERPNSFCLQLKSDPTLKLATTHTDASTAPDKSFLKIARGATQLQTSIIASPATDLVNIAVNSRGSNNVGGLDITEYEWVKDLMREYRMAYMHPNGDGLTGDDKTYYDTTNEFYGDKYIDFMRLYNLAAIFEWYPDYKTFDVNKQYRIELYKEGTGNNNMLSSFESYMKEGATEFGPIVKDNDNKVIADGHGMNTPMNASSILTGGNWSAADASTYWQIYPTKDKTPESGEEVEIAIYNSNVGAFLTKGTDGKAITFDTPCEFNATNASTATKFYVKQEGTSDQWIILDKLSTGSNVSRLTINNEGKFEWLLGYSHGTTIADYKYDNANQNKGRWMFSEIESYPMSISSLKWASICLPYNVRFRKDTKVKAYYASGTSNASEDDKDKFSSMINLTQLEITVTDDETEYWVIPANTPVLLESEGAINFDLFIDDSNSTFSGSNKFTAVNAKWGDLNLAPADGGITDNEYYCLANKKYGVAFYPIIDSPYPYLKANKAFLVAAETQLSSGAKPEAVRFRLYDKGTVTDINLSTGEATRRPIDGVFYDLYGRRINNPKKGIYVNGMGKKFIVK